MNHAVKAGLIAGTIAVAALAPPASAAVAQHSFTSNAVNHCQAFTPGPTNTIRNRVIGSENVGAAMAVACNFHSFFNGDPANTTPTQLVMWFSNNNSAGSITITCTLLTGYQGDSGRYTVTKTTGAIAAGGTDQQFLSWEPSDNPVSGATDLGNSLIGVNCTLPTGGVMNDTYLVWVQDNGV